MLTVGLSKVGYIGEGVSVVYHYQSYSKLGAEYLGRHGSRAARGREVY